MLERAIRDPIDRFDLSGATRVLDVGCGGRPFWRATHLADASPFDSSQRFGLPIKRLGRPLAASTVERLPFCDGAFDFVYCSHVLEHVDGIESACAELARVGKRGYIECPRSWVECVLPAPAHRWLVDLEVGVLVFREKLDSETGDPLGLTDSFLRALQRTSFQRYWNSPPMHRLRTVQLVWEGSVAIKVIRRDERQAGSMHGDIAPRMPHELTQLLAQ